MRIWLAGTLLITLSGCTGMLLGEGRSGGADRTPRTSMEVAADNALTAAVRRRFNDDRLLSTYDFRIETFRNRVTLHGTVDSYSARDHAVRVAGSVEGVDSVGNRIRVVSGN